MKGKFYTFIENYQKQDILLKAYLERLEKDLK